MAADGETEVFIMDKVILVMDDPMFCFNCPLARERPFRGGYVCGIGHPGEYSFVWVYDAVDMESEIKPDWCPLKPVPEKYNMDATYDRDYDMEYEYGYNACIDEILGE